MSRVLLLDTGPLVAAINGRDRFHIWARELLGNIKPPIFTCEAVLAEACFLLQRTHGGSAAVLEFVRRGVLLPQFSLTEHAASITKLMNKYTDVPMALADACLVRMSELHDDCKVASFDSDFLIYRRNGRNTIPLTMPAELH